MHPPNSGFLRAEHTADSHDLIRVQGARENNLKDVSVEIPKRRLTVFTGVSGSGKSSLVFGTIAAESQRLINETYSAFVQGFMPTLDRPEVDVLEGLTTAIIVDQERMGANSRSTVGTVDRRQRDAARAVEPPRQAAHRSSHRLLVQRPDAEGERRDDGRQGQGRTDRGARRRLPRRHVPAMRGHGHRSTTSTCRSSTTTASRSTKARSRFPATRADGWQVRIFAAAGLDPDKPIRKYTKKELQDFLHSEPRKVKFQNINLTYEGLVPRIQKSFLSKDVDAMQPHIRAFVERAVTFTTCPECGGTRLNEAARSSKIKKINIADACAMQINDLAEWLRGLQRAVGRAACWRRCGTRSTRSWRSGWATSASTGRPARCRAVRRSAPR